MKKIVLLVFAMLLLSFSLLSFCACDDFLANMEDVKDNINDATDDLIGGGYHYAIVELFDGSAVEVELKALEYFSINNSIAERVYYVFGTDGTGYIVSSENCVLVADPTREDGVGIYINTSSYEKTEAYLRMPGTDPITISATDIELYNAAMSSISIKGDKTYILDSEDIIIKFTHSK